MTERQEGDKSGQEDTPTRRRYTTKTLMGTWTRRHCRTTTRWQKRDKSRAEDTLTGRQGTTKTPSDTMTNCHYRVGQACHMRPPQDDRQDSEREEEREKGGPCSYGELSCSYGQTLVTKRDGRKGKGTTGRQKGGKGCKAGREEGARKYGREATAGITMKRAVRTREGNEQQRQGRNSGLGKGWKREGRTEGKDWHRDRATSEIPVLREGTTGYATHRRALKTHTPDETKSPTRMPAQIGGWYAVIWLFAHLRHVCLLALRISNGSMNFGGGKGLVIGDVPAMGKAKSKKGGAYETGGGGMNMMTNLAAMFQTLAGQPPSNQWGANWQPAPAAPTYGWGTGWNAMAQGAPTPAMEKGKGGGQTAMATNEGGGTEKGGKPDQTEGNEEYDRMAYEQWKQAREREMQAEQQAAAGTTLRWTTTEQRRGRVKVFLGPEAVRATPQGPRLKHQTEVYGRMVYDWGAVLGKPTPEMIVETTRDLEDPMAHRCQVVCFEGAAARVAAEYETIVTLKGDAKQTPMLQRILGRVDLRSLRQQELRTLEEKIREWAQYHGRPYSEGDGKGNGDQQKQIEKMTKMLKRMGLTDEQITKKLCEDTQAEGGWDGDEERRGEDGDVEMDTGSDRPTERDSHGTIPWAAPYLEQQEDPRGGMMKRESDSYLEMRAGTRMSPDCDVSNDSDPIGPCTDNDLRKLWTGDPRGGSAPKQKDRKGEEEEARARKTWRKGLPKATDKEGEWDVYNAATQPSRAGRSGGATSSSAGRTDHSAPTRRGEERRTTGGMSETKKAETKTRGAKTPSTEKTQPPRGGRAP